MDEFREIMLRLFTWEERVYWRQEFLKKGMGENWH